MSWLARGFLILLVLTAAGAARAADPPADKVHEFVLGSAKAKVTVIEYASLTCPHCAHFQNETFPRVKQNDIDTGKIRFVFRDFPLDGLAMAGAVIARCVAPDKGHKFVAALFADQEKWAPEPLKGFYDIGKTVGISQKEVDTCLENEQLVTAMREEQKRAGEDHKIQYTPTFLIGDEKLEGDISYEEFTAAIDRQLAKAGGRTQ